ncbi:MAG TPA: GNAT family N-acetyltransferase [Vicinamibacterales bacterium]|nr:GNAT family N-acetyltransferase [Vicinamibacterales bacterium]
MRADSPARQDATSTHMAVSSYPSEYDSDVVLRDGTTLHLRPIRPDDDAGLLEMFSRMSQESLYYRFMSVPRMDLQKMSAFTHVDYDNQFVLVGEAGGPIAALAGYYRSDSCPDRAEVAFSVPDALQGKGIGTRMLERLAEIARERGISAFDAYVLGENRRMLEVFRESGFDVSQELERGVFHVSLSIEPTTAYTERAAERSQKAATASMRAFFEPRVAAVVGANRQPGRIGSEILRNLKETGFTGTLVPVHPGAGELEGLQAYPSVAAIPGSVDLAVIVVPAASVAGVVDDCIAKGVKALVVISAGFRETGDEGRALEAALVEKIRAAGIRMIGPNCMGIINTDPRFRLNATFSPVYPPEGRVAFSTQSGALGLAILDYVRTLKLGISSFASIGNKADVSGNDLIQYWAEDPRTDVILLYLESFGNPKRFGQIARRVGRRKPIAAVKAGRSTAGARAATSHTGARASSDALVDTLLRQAGVIRTHTLEELFDVAALLASQPVPDGRRVAIVTNAGGPGILAADACEANGLELPALDSRTVEGLRAFLPTAASVANPIDMIASAPPEHYRRTVELVLADPNVDSLVVIFIPPLVTAAEDVAAAITAAIGSSTKPVLATFMGARGAVPQLSVPSYMFPESAAVALARVTHYGEWLRKPVGGIPHLSGFDRDGARHLVAEALAAGGGWMAPLEAEALLDACGISAVESRFARTADEAAQVAASLGFPVVLKAVGPSLLHKTEVGGVRLGLASTQAVRDAFADFAVRLAGKLDGALVQRMVAGGVEMVVGALNDPSFGPVVMAGTGGIFVELVGDTVFRMCPLAEHDAADMIDEMKGRVLLRGYRGAPPVDEAAFRSVLLRVSQLADACPEIHEMDVNPLKVLDSGAVAVDVRIRIAPRVSGVKGRRVTY